jgi:hypothetical protein
MQSSLHGVRTPCMPQLNHLGNLVICPEANAARRRLSYRIGWVVRSSRLTSVVMGNQLESITGTDCQTGQI